jgi:hypothetical protein
MFERHSAPVTLVRDSRWHQRSHALGHSIPSTQHDEFVDRQRTPLARAQIAYRKRGVADPRESQNLKAGRFTKTPHLAIPSFGEHDLKPCFSPVLP